MSEPRGDKPRKIVVCNPADYPKIQKAVAALDYGDVLVKTSRGVDAGEVIVMDGSILDPPVVPLIYGEGA